MPFVSRTWGGIRKRLLFVLKSTEALHGTVSARNRGWAPGRSPCESPPLCLRTRGQHPACLWARRPGGEGLCSLGVEGHGVGGWAALFKQLELGDLKRVVCPGFSKEAGGKKKKICPACQGIGKEGPPPRGETNCQPHKPPPDCGKAARRASSTSTGYQPAQPPSAWASAGSDSHSGRAAGTSPSTNEKLLLCV